MSSKLVDPWQAPRASHGSAGHQATAFDLQAVDLTTRRPFYWMMAIGLGLN